MPCTSTNDGKSGPLLSSDASGDPGSGITSLALSYLPSLDEAISTFTRLAQIDDNKAFEEAPLSLLPQWLRSTGHDARLNEIVINTLFQRLQRQRIRRPSTCAIESLAIESFERNGDIDTMLSKASRSKQEFRKPLLLLVVNICRAWVEVHNCLSIPALGESSIQNFMVDLCPDHSLSSSERLKFSYQTVSSSLP